MEIELLKGKSGDIFDLALYHKTFAHVLEALRPCCRFCKMSSHALNFYTFPPLKRNKSDLEKSLEIEHFLESMDTDYSCEGFTTCYLKQDHVKEDSICSDFEYCRLEIQKAYEYEKQNKVKEDFEKKQKISKQNNATQLMFDF